LRRHRGILREEISGKLPLANGKTLAWQLAGVLFIPTKSSGLRRRIADARQQSCDLPIRKHASDEVSGRHSVRCGHRLIPNQIVAPAMVILETAGTAAPPNALAKAIRGKLRLAHTTMESLIEELKTKLIAGFNLEGVTPADIKPDEPIFGTGLELDSIDALELVAILESDYGIVISERAVADKAFASLRALAEFVAAHRT
jgi:acyl carrier protein